MKRIRTEKRKRSTAGLLAKRRQAVLAALLLAVSVTACTLPVSMQDQTDQTPASAATSAEDIQGHETGESAETQELTEDSETQEQSSFRTLYSSELSTLNYLATNNANDYAVSANLVDCLVDYDRYGNIIPGLAESWEANEDKTEWTFHIREGVKWVDCNGEPVADVTADDWVAAAEYVNDAANGSGSRYMYNTGAVVRGAQAYYEYTAYMLLSEGGTKTQDEDGNAIEPVEEVKPDEIGVHAADERTLVYTLDQPCPFFLSVLSYTSYMPVNRDFLEQAGDMFGMSREDLLYNGAYYLSVYEPQEERVLTRNPLYWDAENVYIEEIIATYNAEAEAVGAAMIKNDEIDSATISTDLLDSWLQDEETKDLVHASRPNNSYSYFYAFNFDPQFDEEYEPENWKLAVGNENFRHALMASLDRIKALAVQDPYNPEILLNNTVTPSGFAAAAGRDFTEYDALAGISAADSFQEEAAIAYRDAALEELKAQGASFPVRVLMPYNPATTNWDKECQVVEQQIEGLLGSDFIDLIIQAGPETGFLSAVRRSGQYAFMKCNWGADYADPQTWTEPFTDGNTYNFWYRSEDPAVQELFAEYAAAVERASSIYDDEEARYAAFAKAEALLIRHAVIIPYSIHSQGGYQVSKLDPTEGEFAPYGLANFRYKGRTVHEKSMNMEEFKAALAQWEEDREEALAEIEAAAE